MQLRLTAIVVTGMLAVAIASEAKVDVNVNIGAPSVVVREVVPPPPPPVPPRRTVIIEDVPDFIYPSSLGFYVAVGVPYDLYYVDDYYYMYRDGLWHRSYDYGGPWKVIKGKRVPYGLRRHRIDTIRHHRDREYVIYQRDRDHYRGRHFRPDHDWKERRKHEHREWKEDRKQEKREWKEERKREREDWRDERHHEREDWREDRDRHRRGRE